MANNVNSISGNEGVEVVQSIYTDSGTQDSDRPVDGTFFPPVTIDPKRWDKLYPYRLVVVDVSDNYSVVTKSGGVETSATSVGPNSFRIGVTPIFDKWEYVLPITPQQLSISTPFAIATTATLRGIVEEHGGVRFKIINMSGTFGGWPNRPSVGKTPKNLTSVETLFSGTISAASNASATIDRIKNLTNNFSQGNTGAAVTGPMAKSPGQSTSNTNDLYATGYSMALMMDRFLEQYAELKRTPGARNYALALDIPKQNQTFLVTPMSFNWNQSVDAPTQIRFSLQLKAWKRINLSSSDEALTPSLTKLTPSTLQRVINAVQNARILAGQALNLIKAVRSDFQKPLNVMRETALFIKQAAGLPATVIDLPRQIVEDYRTSIKGSINIVSSSLVQATTSASTRATTQSFASTFAQNEGLSDDAIASGQLGNSAKLATLTDPTNNIFKSPEQNFEIFNTINVNQLNLSPEQKERVENEYQRISEITVDDIVLMRSDIEDLASKIANAFGAGSDVLNQIERKPPPYNRLQKMTIDEYTFLKSLYDLIQSYDILTATQEIDNGRIESSMEYVSGLADAVSMPFDIPTSKILAPVPFGLSIEQIAARYLGDPQKWVEIATLNALKSPYIDELGFEKNFLSNASGRLFNIADAQNLYINQKVTLRSDAVPPQTRKIIDIQKINDTNYLVTVDGLDNLDNLTAAQNARLLAYLPCTTNSQNQIWIPSDLPVDEIDSRAIPALRDEKLVGLSKVDWLLDDSGDIALNAYGDIRLSAGMTNIIQALKMKFLVPRNRLLIHPNYGAGVEVGDSGPDVDATGIYEQVLETLKLDPRFDGIVKLEVVRNGPTLTLNLSVKLANGKGVFPLSFNIE